jgi:hypothetical protein
VVSQAWASSLAVACPSSVQPGDLIAIWLVANDSAAPVLPSGYSSAVSGSDYNGNLSGFYYHVYEAGDPTSVTFVYGETVSRSAICAVYAGVDAGNPIDTQASQVNSVDTTIVSPSVTTSVANDMLLMLYSLNTIGSVSTPSLGAIEQQETYGDQVTAWVDQPLTDAGATGDQSVQFGSDVDSFAAQVALAPAACNTSAPTPAPTADPPSPAADPPPTQTPLAGSAPSPTASFTPVPTVSVSPIVTATPTASSGTDALDSYGGTTAVQCANGPEPHFYTEKLGNRWWLCDPAGNGFFLKGVYDVTWTDSSTLTSKVASKYATGPNSYWGANWALETVRRLNQWGFNTLSEYAAEYVWPGMQAGWNTADGTIPQKMPFLYYENPSSYSLTNNSNYASGAVKDILNGIKSTVYTGYRSHIIDAFDPNFGGWLAGALQHDWATGVALDLHNDYFIGFDMDESDDTMGIRAGPDFETVDDSYTGALAAGHNMPQTAWLVLVTAPNQASNSSLGQTYSNQTVYSKQALSSYFASEYGNSIAALNKAWGSSYTTFTTSDSRGLAGIQTGGYASFGAGSGLLDEDGTCPSKAAGQSCWIGVDPYNLTGETAAMQADLSGFFSYWLDQYFGAQKTQYNRYAPGYLLTQEIGGWGAPPRKEVLTEAAKYVDMFTLEEIPPYPCSNCTDAQARINFTAQYGGDKPWINWQGFFAQQDSYLSAYMPPPGYSGTAAYTTQAARGTSYQNMVSTFANAADSNGTYHIVGFEWWCLYDMSSMGNNYGLITPNDNAYDGREAIIATGKDQWGYSTGGESANYGDFLDPVQSANLGVYSQLATPGATPTP